MAIYTIKFAHKNRAFFAAANKIDEYIVIEALGSYFEIGHQVIFDGVNILNFTEKEETSAIVQCQTDRQGAIEYFEALDN